MVTIDALDRFVHTLSGNVFHIEFDRCGNGRLSVYADTWERTLCHHAEDGANVRVFSVPLTGDAFDFDHDDYLLEKLLLQLLVKEIKKSKSDSMRLAFLYS